jgi:hypothetical protein
MHSQGIGTVTGCAGEVKRGKSQSALSIRHRFPGSVIRYAVGFLRDIDEVRFERGTAGSWRRDSGLPDFFGPMKTAS